MRPCTGIQGLCPALCNWAQLTDGSLSLADVERFNQAMDEMLAAHEAAKGSR